MKRVDHRYHPILRDLDLGDRDPRLTRDRIEEVASAIFLENRGVSQLIHANVDRVSDRRHRRTIRALP